MMGAIWLLDPCTHTRVVAGIGALSSPDQIGEKEKSGCHAAPGQDRFLPPDQEKEAKLNHRLRVKI